MSPAWRVRVKVGKLRWCAERLGTVTTVQIDGIELREMSTSVFTSFDAFAGESVK